MGFEINEEQKVRISLSKRAFITMTDDMNIFSVSKPSTFINTVFENFYDTAKSSVRLYLQEKRIEFDKIFSNSELDNNARTATINQLLETEEKQLEKMIKSLLKDRVHSALYHINTRNTEYLTNDDCKESTYFHKQLGKYMKCIMEEYCSLPFIERERIYKRQVYETIEAACSGQKEVKIEIPFHGEKTIFRVQPYKIMSDPMKTQSYLVCYSRKDTERSTDKIPASFSMARLPMPKITAKKSSLSKKEISDLEEITAKYSPTYLVGKIEEIHVRLTKKGIETYQRKLYARPYKEDALSSENEYVFFCSQLQAYNYFYSFGEEAEILSPMDLRNKFHQEYSKALSCYETNN